MYTYDSLRGFFPPLAGREGWRRPRCSTSHSRAGTFRPSCPPALLPHGSTRKGAFCNVVRQSPGAVPVFPAGARSRKGRRASWRSSPGEWSREHRRRRRKSKNAKDGTQLNSGNEHPVVARSPDLAEGLPPPRARKKRRSVERSPFNLSSPPSGSTELKRLYPPVQLNHSPRRLGVGGKRSGAG
jgi:hypothetical protein